MLTCVKADDRSRAETDNAPVKDEVKLKDVNVQEPPQNAADAAELMQIRVENIKNNQEKGPNNSPRYCNYDA